MITPSVQLLKVDVAVNDAGLAEWLERPPVLIREYSGHLIWQLADKAVVQASGGWEWQGPIDVSHPLVHALVADLQHTKVHQQRPQIPIALLQ